MRVATPCLLMLCWSGIAPNRAAAQEPAATPDTLAADSTGAMRDSIPLGERLTNGGVLLASAVVDSVFVDGTLDSAFVLGGDFGSYLMARLNIWPIPRGLRLRVTVDTTGITIGGRLRDLPPEARAALGPLLGMFPPDTRVAGEISLAQVAREVVRFRLERVLVNGIALPEPLVAAVMLDVAKQYPALSRTGRALFVEVPQDARIVLATGGVWLQGPPADPPAQPSEQ